jgi:hypothetical protein
VNEECADWVGLGVGNDTCMTWLTRSFHIPSPQHRLVVLSVFLRKKNWFGFLFDWSQCSLPIVQETEHFGHFGHFGCLWKCAMLKLK